MGGCSTGHGNGWWEREDRRRSVRGPGQELSEFNVEFCNTVVGDDVGEDEAG